MLQHHSLKNVKKVISLLMLAVLLGVGFSLPGGGSNAHAAEVKPTQSVQPLAGCFLGYYCGKIINNTDSFIYTKWSNDDKTWDYWNVAPHSQAGGNGTGWDIDFWYVPVGCTDYGTIEIAGITSDHKHWNGGQWVKIGKEGVATINSRSC